MKKYSKERKPTLRDLLFEQEEEAEEIFGEEEPDEETEETEDTEDEGAEEDAEEGDEEEAEEGAKDDEAPSVENVESIDGDIEAVLIDFETTARRSAVSEAKSLRSLYESEEVLDLDSFAGDVARLVKNYDNLLDIEGMLVNKSKTFLADRYGEDVANNFIEKLEDQHDIEEPTSGDPIPDTNLQTPLAIGAGAASE